MAYYHARANVCRAGVTRAGLANAPAVFTVGATARTANVTVDDFAITTALNGSPSTCQFSVQGFTPALGNDVTLTLGGDLVWGGTLINTRVAVQKFTSGVVVWQCEAIDWTWLMDRFDRVNLIELGAARGANGLIAQILRDFTNGGFSTGYIPMDIGNVGPFTFDAESVSSALRRIAAQANGYLRITAAKRVDMFATLPVSNALSVVNSSRVRSVTYESSLAQVRTRTYYRGRGSQTTAVVLPNATTIPVEECSFFAGALGQAVGDRFGYTGRTVASGPGSLSGVTGVAYEIPKGSMVYVLAQADDAAAQAALATVLGGGRSGVAVGWFSSDLSSATEAADLATSDLTFFSAAMPSFSYTTTDRYHEPGKQVTVTLTDPVTVSGLFRIQSVTMTAFGAIQGNTPKFQYQVACRLMRRADVIDLLEKG